MTHCGTAQTGSEEEKGPVEPGSVLDLLLMQDNFGGEGLEEGAIGDFGVVDKWAGEDVNISGTQIGEEEQEIRDQNELKEDTPTVIKGCTDPTATNYNEDATQDDGTCRYPGDPDVKGCMDPSADNYNALANIDDGSCVYSNVPPGIIYEQTNFPLTTINNSREWAAFHKKYSDGSGGYPCLIKTKYQRGLDVLIDPVDVEVLIQRLKNENVNESTYPGFKNLCTHVTAMNGKMKGKYAGKDANNNHHGLAFLFLHQKDKGAGWSRHGYHISVARDGSCNYNIDFSKGFSNGIGPNAYSDVTINGLRAKNSNTINISWQGSNNGGGTGGLAKPELATGDAAKNTKPNITEHQAKAYIKLLFYFTKAFPNIKIFGHNQITTGKCPKWNNHIPRSKRSEFGGRKKYKESDTCCYNKTSGKPCKGTGKSCPTWNQAKLNELLNIPEKNRYDTHLDQLSSAERNKITYLPNLTNKDLSNFTWYHGSKYNGTAHYVHRLVGNMDFNTYAIPSNSPSNSGEENQNPEGSNANQTDSFGNPVQGSPEYKHFNDMNCEEFTIFCKNIMNNGPTGNSTQNLQMFQSTLSGDGGEYSGTEERADFATKMYNCQG